MTEFGATMVADNHCAHAPRRRAMPGQDAQWTRARRHNFEFGARVTTKTRSASPRGGGPSRFCSPDDLALRQKFLGQQMSDNQSGVAQAVGGGR
jgi:hypothetical protein